MSPIRKWTLAIGASAMLLLASERAMAERPAKEEVASTEDESYTTPMLLAHAVPLGATWATAIVADANRGKGEAYITAFYVTLPASVLAPPVVHAWHGNWGRGAASLGLNLVASIPGHMFFGLALVDSCDETGRPCRHDTLKTAAAVHTVFNGVATFADVAMADREPKQPTTGAPRVVVHPAVSALPGGVFLGAHGVF